MSRFARLSLCFAALALVAAKPKPAMVAPEAAPQPLVFADEAFRATQPPPAPLHPFTPPKPQVFQLASGLDVLLVERHELPTVSLQLLFDTGSEADPQGQEGLASVCLGLLAEGTQKLDRVAYQEALADLASSVSSFADSDQEGLALSTLTRNLDATMELWADALLHPGMRQEEFDRDIRRAKAGLQQIKGSPAALAARLAGRIAWGPGHPRGRFKTDKSLSALNLGGCRALVARDLHPAGAHLFVVGDITRTELEAKLTWHLRSWSGKAPALVLPEPPKPAKGKVFFVALPGAEQAVLSLVHGGPKRTDPDYQATALMATLLGGGFSSRINMNIREKHGYAYGARGGFDYYRGGSHFIASASVRNDTVSASVTEILNEMKGMRDADVTPAELSRDKEGAILSLPARWATGRSILSTFQGLLYFGLPLDDYDHFIERVQAVTATAVRDAAKAHVQPGGVQVLCVGDPVQVRPQLEALVRKDGALQGGEIVELDADGQVLQ